MTFDYKKPFTTRDGRKARLLADNLDNTHPIVVAVTTRHMEIETIKAYKKDGTTGYGFPDDTLVNIPERREFWMKVTLGGVSPILSSKTEAEEYKMGWQTFGFLKLIYEDDKLVDQEYFKFDGD